MIQTRSFTTRAQIQQVEAELVKQGYREVQVRSPKSLQRGEYFKSQATGSHTSFEGPGVFEITWMD